MRRYLRTTLNPNAYHGHGKKPPFFEGWYFKVVDTSERHRYAIIPGAFIGQTAADSHAFVQVLDGTTGQATYTPYPWSEFWAADGVFDVRIGPNRFTADRISLDITDPVWRVRGELRFAPLSPWPVTWTSPGIMGWYAWVPRMECYHGVVSLDHGIEGTLWVDEQPLDFNRGRGYIEKDWGQAFPEAWIWMQTNHFSQPGTSLTASLAIIPWVRQAFPGFIVGLWHERKLYRFATYTGARTEHLTVDDQHVHWIVRSKKHRLEMLATRAEGGLLHAPTTAAMDRRIAETLSGSIAVTLSALAGGTARILMQDTGRYAGLEAVGDLARLIGMWRGVVT